MAQSRPSAFIRKAVFDRARGCCEYCQSQAAFSPQSFSVEHIFPKSAGGSNELDNLALACQGCNSYKFTKTEAIDPVTGKLVPLFHPRQQKWEDHFQWNSTCSVIIGRTPIGRASTLSLRLNRQSLINLRTVMYAMGEHPLSS